MKALFGFLRFLFRFLLKLILFLLLIALFPYILPPVYDFPEPEPFSGNLWYNPYDIDGGKWLQGNFNASAKAWGGVTAGKDSHVELYNFYKDLGYDIVGFSDYQQISPPVDGQDIYIPLYEHGYSVFKRHHLLLGAKEVSWYDFLFYQSIHHKQDVLKILQPQCEVLTIAHPKFLWAYTQEDFARLTNYNLIEVLNHFRISDMHWDAALSAGKPVWILGNDDTHDIRDKVETAGYWTMIYSQSEKPEDIYNALKLGRAYGATGSSGQNRNFLRDVKITGDTLTIECSSPVDMIEFIGQGGTRDTVNIHGQSYGAYYLLNDEDTYVRTVVHSGNFMMYLNPVVRFNGGKLNFPEAKINWGLSILYWIAAWGVYLLLIYYILWKYIILGVFKKNRKPEKI